MLSSGRPLKRVAAELGVTANSLPTWRDRAFGKGRVAQAASAEPKGRSEAPLADPAGEIRRLQRENEYLPSPKCGLSTHFFMLSYLKAVLRASCDCYHGGLFAALRTLEFGGIDLDFLSANPDKTSGTHLR